MKKLFTLLTAILLTASMAMQAQLLSEAGDIPEAGNLLNTNSEIKDMAGRRNGPNMTVNGIIYNSNCYCKVQYVGDNKFDIWFKTNSNNTTVFYIKNVPMASATNINGSHNFSKYSNSDTNTTTWFYTTSNTSAKKGNPYGYISFIYTGRTSSDGDPMYKIYIYCTACAGQLNYQNQYGNYGFDGEMGVYAVDENGNAMALDNNVYEEVNVPGNTTRTTGSCLAWEGENESFRCHFETNGNESSQCNTTFFNTIVWSSTWMKRLPDGSQSMPNNGYVKEEDSNGFHFLDTYFSYSNAVRHTTMQYPNYQAVNTSYSAEFDWNDVTLIKKNNNTITLTAVDATSQKKAVIDFVVNGEINNANPVIPAGSYTIGTSGDAGTVIASKGINRDLSINSSYAGSTTALTAANCASNPLWCFRTGTVTVGEDQSVTVVANQSYRGSPVDITINGPVLEGSYNVSTGVNPSGAGYITGTVGEAAFADGTYDAGTSITLTAHNNAGWRFDKWNNNATANPYTFVLLKDTSLTAQFIKTYVVTVNDDGRGTVTGGNTYDVNEVAQLSATSNNEHLYFFQKWQKLNGETYEDFDGNTANPINVTVTADATYKAVFRQASNGTIVGIADHGTITGGGNYNGGDAVELEVTSDEGWYFTQWSDGNTENPRTVYVDGDHDYTAQFVEGVEIVVANGTYDVQGNYFDITGSANNYTVQFESYGVSTLQTGAYSSSDIYKADTYVQYNGGEKITFTNRQATISRVGIMTWRLDATLSNATGPVYHLVIDVQKTLNGDYSSNINHTFTEGIDVYVDNTDDNIWWITTSGTWETVGLERWWSDFAVYIDKTKQCGSNGIPSGIYTVAYPPSAGNVVPTISYSTDVNSSNPTYDGTIGGYYNNGYYNYFFPVSGTIEIINNNGSYYFNANLRNSRDKTLTESYGSRPSSYTVTVASNNNVLGSVQISTCGTGAVPNQTNKYYENTTLSLTAVPSGDNLFDHWELDGEEVEGEDETYDYTVSSSNAEIVAVFKKNTVYYTVTFKDYDGSTTLQSGNVEENTKPTIAADPTRADDEVNNIAYSFIGWKSSADENVYTTANLPVATAAVTYTAQYEPYFLLLDDKTDNNDAYYTALANKEGERLNVKYMRTFTAGRWATFSLPFGYSYRLEENTTFKGQVYYLISAKYTADGYLTLNCMPVTDGLVANKPYILIPSATIENPTFKNVKMKAVAPNYYTAPNTEGIGTGVEFRNTTERETLARDKRVIYIKGANNQLYYPSMSVDTWMRPFRGYFYLNVTPEQIQYTPARVRLVTPEGEYIEQVPDTEEAATVETKKYIENGILIIERAGMKYDAQGHVIK